MRLQTAVGSWSRSNANVYASGWPLRMPGIIRMVRSSAYCWSVARSRSRIWLPKHMTLLRQNSCLAVDPSEQVVHELLWSAANMDVQQ